MLVSFFRHLAGERYRSFHTPIHYANLLRQSVTPIHYPPAVPLLISVCAARQPCVNTQRPLLDAVTHVAEVEPGIASAEPSPLFKRLPGRYTAKLQRMVLEKAFDHQGELYLSVVTKLVYRSHKQDVLVALLRAIKAQSFVLSKQHQTGQSQVWSGHPQSSTDVAKTWFHPARIRRLNDQSNTAGYQAIMVSTF